MVQVQEGKAPPDADPPTGAPDREGVTKRATGTSSSLSKEGSRGQLSGEGLGTGTTSALPAADEPARRRLRAK
eukprot:2339721-Amphidinium_carterae.1